MNARRWLLVVLVAICVVLVLTSCAALAPDPVGWESAPSHRALPAVVRHVSQSHLRHVCGPRALACALRDEYGSGKCYIFVHDVMLDTLEHERHHCEGYDHAER